MKRATQRGSALVLIASVLCGAPVEAQMRPLTQSRTVFARATVPQASPPTNQQTIAAPDMGPFHAIAIAQQSSWLGTAGAVTSQDSTIGGGQISCTLDTSASAYGIFDPLAASSSLCTALFQVQFELAFPVRFRATGNLSSDWGYGPQVDLSSQAGLVFSIAPQSIGTEPFSQIGAIGPGRFTLLARATANAYDDGAVSYGHQSAVTVDFRVESLIGVAFCTTSPNSSGASAVIGASGSSVVAQQDLSLHVSGATPNALGLFFYGPAQASQPFGSGTLCIGGPLYRLSVPAPTSAVGSLDFTVDFNAAPAGSAPSAFAPGVTLYFQFWFRDAAANPAFNTSNGLSIAFQ